MSSARHKRYDSEGQYHKAVVRGNEYGTATINCLDDDLVLTHQVHADKVIVGGEHPDDAREVHLQKPTRFGVWGIDLRVRHDDGNVVVWLAP